MVFAGNLCAECRERVREASLSICLSIVHAHFVGTGLVCVSEK
jgi:hypothetical protein